MREIAASHRRAASNDNRSGAARSDSGPGGAVPTNSGTSAASTAAGLEGGEAQNDLRQRLEHGQQDGIRL